MTFEQVATLPQAAVIALQGPRDIRQLEPRQHVLINGAGGGMGTFAVQIAKAFGAEVTGVDSARKLDMVRSIGAEHVIDYAPEDFTQGEQRYDLILDMVGNHSISDIGHTLSPTGNYVLVGGPVARFLQVQMSGARDTQTQNQKLSILMWKSNQKEDVAQLQGLFETGKITPVIDGSYPLSETPEALRRLEQGRALGKIVITV